MIAFVLTFLGERQGLLLERTSTRTVVANNKYQHEINTGNRLKSRALRCTFVSTFGEADCIVIAGDWPRPQEGEKL